MKIHLTIPVKIALFSFAIGTLLFALQFLFPNKYQILIIGLFYTIIAVLFNFATLLYLIRKLIIVPTPNPKTIEEIAIILANIPITALYIFIIFNQNNF